LPDQLNSILDDPDGQRAILVAEITSMLQSNRTWTIFETLAELDRRLVAPALTALRRGLLESVILIANDTELRLRRHAHLKLWRRSRPGISGL
jgi:hypothetical protein